MGNMAATGDGLAFLEVFLFFVGLSGCVLTRIQYRENAPYMDEVFHIPQVQNYCLGKFSEWDPMITTLPGLYLTTVGLLKPLGAIFGFSVDVFCSVIWLRSVNVVFAAGNLYLLYQLLKTLHKDVESGKLLLSAFILSVFPVLYFFTFLYYTDSGATFFVLLMYLFSLHGNHKTAAVIGILAVAFRQTNIVWVMFVAGLATSNVVLDRIQPEKKDISPEAMQDMGFLQVVLGQLWSWLKNNKKSLFSLLGTILLTTWPYIAVGVTFAVFVILNGSIVVGAKSDHTAILHFPQLFYFASFACVFSFPYHISMSHLKGFLKFLFRKCFVVLLFVILGMFVIWKFTYAHRYLLADNRHYTFYVWAKIYRRHDLVKYGLLLPYMYAIWSMLCALRSKNILWKCVYCLCVALNLVPSPLLEFRYFIVPYLIFRLNMTVSSYPKLALELVLYSVVNAVTLYLFMEKPFTWENTSGNQRFMW